MNVFISYRHEDVPHLAGRIFDGLSKKSELSVVFLDAAAVAPGADFINKIETALIRKPVCVVLIGERWQAEVDKRLSSEMPDYVLFEVSRMLSYHLRVIPVLADRANMPNPGDLPAEVRGLADIKAIRIRHDTFSRDLEYLVDNIKEKSRSRQQGWYRPLRALLLSLSSNIVLLVIIGVVHFETTGLAIPDRFELDGLGEALMTLFLVIGTITGMWLPRFLQWTARFGRKAIHRAPPP